MTDPDCADNMPQLAYLSADAWGELVAPRYFARPYPVRGMAPTIGALHRINYVTWRDFSRVLRIYSFAYGDL